MGMCIMPNLSEVLSASNIPLIFKDEDGHRIENISKITFKTFSESICFVTIDYLIKDEVSKNDIEKNRTLILKECRFELLSLSIYKDEERVGALLKSNWSNKIPWYVKLSIKIVNNFFKNKRSNYN